MPSHLTIVVAVDMHNGIGINNTLPWHLTEDLVRFKRTTSGHPIIMGRKTFDSIGRPLPKRRNIVITRNAAWQQEGVEAVSSLTEAKQLVGDDVAFIIGGAQIYADTLAEADCLIVTRIEKAYRCDAFFPPIDPVIWKEMSCEQHHSDSGGFDYAFIKYERIESA